MIDQDCSSDAFLVLADKLEDDGAIEASALIREEEAFDLLPWNYEWRIGGVGGGV